MYVIHVPEVSTMMPIAENKKKKKKKKKKI